MASLKQPEIVVHSIFQDYGSDLDEIVDCITSFLDGDCGHIRDEDEVLGFMKKSLEGKFRHGAYRTETGGWVHVVGDNDKIIAMPDLIYAQGTKDVDCSINICECGSNHKAELTKPTQTK